MTIERFPNRAGICIAFGDNVICLGEIFDDGFGVTFCFHWMRKTVVWKVKKNNEKF